MKTYKTQTKEHLHWEKKFGLPSRIKAKPKDEEK